jgi:hypothetical protein
VLLSILSLEGGSLLRHARSQDRRPSVCLDVCLDDRKRGGSVYYVGRNARIIVAVISISTPGNAKLVCRSYSRLTNTFEAFLIVLGAVEIF